jgi:hypothetical protein
MAAAVEEAVTDTLLFLDAVAMPQHHRYAELLRMDEAIAAREAVSGLEMTVQEPSPEPVRSFVPQHGT